VRRRRMTASTRPGWRRALAPARLAPYALPVLAPLVQPAAAQERTRQVTLNEAIELFGRNSLELRIARAEAMSASGATRQSKAYSNPGFTVVHEDLGSGAEDNRETTVGVEQRLEWPGRTSARARAATHRIEAAQAAFVSDSARLLFEVRRAYAAAWAAEARERALERATRIIARVADAAESRFAAGDISGYEVRRLRLERVRSDQELAEAGLQSSSGRRALAALVLPESEVRELGPAQPLAGEPPDIPLGPALEALPARPDLLAAERGVEAARAELSVASAGWVPDPTISLGYKEQADRFSGAVLGLSIPVPLFDRNGGATDAARGRHAAASAALGLRRREARNDLLAAHERHVSTRAGLAAGAGLLDDADALLEAAETAYTEGEIGLVELLDAARAFRDAGTTAVALQADAWIAYYDMLRAMGRASEEIR